MLTLRAICRPIIVSPALLAALTSLAASEPRGPFVIYIGTQGEAIYAAEFNEDTNSLTGLGAQAQIERPTWLDIDPNNLRLYAASEVGNDGSEPGEVASLSIDPTDGSLTKISQVESGGGGSTHVAFDRESSTLFVSHYGTGHVAALSVDSAGRISRPSSIVLDIGSGPSEKQKGPHAHAAVLDPSAKFLLVPDMGADRIFLYHFDRSSRQLSPGEPGWLQLPPGTGPRHLVFEPSGRFAYMVAELTAEVWVLSWNAEAGCLEPVQTLALDPVNFAGEHSASEIVVRPDGRFLYVANRTRNLIQAFAINSESGLLSHIQDITSGGPTPRSFAVSPDGLRLIVANQVERTIEVLAIDRTTGRMSPTGSTLEIPERPVSIAILPRILPQSADAMRPNQLEETDSHLQSGKSSISSSAQQSD